MTKRVLIAGGAGFIGSHLCDYYIARGHEVVCIDNLSTGRSKNIAHLLADQAFTFFQGDICDGLPEAVTAQKYDVILNMASPASPPHYQRLALETLRVGSVGTQHLLELAQMHQARFLQASTSEVYGDPIVHPQTESYYGNVNSYGPRSMYDEAKRYAEALIYVYCNKKAVNTAIIRIFNTYGPRMDPNDGRVVSNFITQALRGAPITIYGEGGQTRSFCYIDDLVRGIVAVVDSEEHGPINLGSPEECTISEIAQRVLQLVPSSASIMYLPLPGDDPTQRRPDISLAEAKLDWRPAIRLDDGLRRTLDYFRRELTADVVLKNSTEAAIASTTVSAV